MGESAILGEKEKKEVSAVVVEEGRSKPKKEKASKKEVVIEEERKNWLYYTRNPLTDAYRDNLYKENYACVVMLSFRGNENEKSLGLSLKITNNFSNTEEKISNLESFLFYTVVGEKQQIGEEALTLEVEDFTSADGSLIRFLDTIFREGEHIYENGKIWLKGSLASDMLDILKYHSSIIVEGKPAFVSERQAETYISGSLDERDDLKLSLKISLGEEKGDIDTEKVFTFGRECSYFYYRNVFYPSNPSYAKVKRDLFPSNPVIQHKFIKDFHARVLPSLKRDFRLVLPENVMDVELKVFPAQAVVFLDFDGTSVFAAMRFKYGKYSVDPYTGEAVSADGETVTASLYRDKEKEDFLCKTLGKYLKREGQYTFSSDDDEEIFYLSYKALPALQDKNWTFFYSESFRQLKLNVKPPKMSVKLTKDIDFFSVEFSIDGVNELCDISSLQASVREGKEYIRLQNGSFIPVDLEVMGYVAKLFTENSGASYSNSDSHLLPLFNAPYFVDELEKMKGVEIDLNSDAISTITKIKQGVSDESLPLSLVGEPRPYQEEGYRWLRKLANMSLGGILADDMGLGKSFQTIATILKEKEIGNTSPTLIICPTSCVMNWFVEIGKFAPSLDVVVIQGATAKRDKQIRSIPNYDVAVTSYASLRRDVKRYNPIALNYVILDEAQHIKNANTQNAKAAKALKSEKRLVLTGTPMENSISELWSIFDFLMPGFFPRHKSFVELYEIPILSENNGETLEALKRKIEPFILRRLKKDVLKDLPPKHTNIAYCDLSAEQKELYLSILDAAKIEIFDAVKKKGFKNAKIEIFSALTRLRQVCCHPKLTGLDSAKHITSGKFNMFMEMINEVIDGGHHVIVFSQFTRMLKIIREALKRKNIGHLYLDGATKDRMDLVQRFNAGEASVFLLSLKAAGTGLTLTKADTVIHFDLWWNPAVEDQATDRAYRFGQTREVTNYKLVTKGTIEEKMLALQDKKRELIDSVIGKSTGKGPSLSWDEVKSLLE